MSIASFFSICKAISDRIKESSFLKRSRKNETAFTRIRKMPFCDIVYFIMSCTNRSLQTELDEYFYGKGSEGVSRQGFTKARENLKHEAFVELSNLVIETFEAEDGEIETFHGYRLFGVDGSIINLPNNEKLREHFGYSSNGLDTVFAKGLAITAFDVLNGLTVSAELYRYDDSEKRRMLDISDDFAELKYDKMIWLLDRGYPSFELFDKFKHNNQNYLVRVSSNSLKEINKANEPDQIVTITRKSETLDLRVVNVTLSTGEVEKLVTNLSAEFTPDDLKKLYAKRWGIETSYMFLKTKALVEVFTGESVTAVMQDFHSTILLLNMATIAAREQNKILQENNAISKRGKTIGCEYKANKTKLIGSIKEDFVKLMLSNSKAVRVFREYRVFSKIKRFAYLNIPDRSFERHGTNKHSRRRAHPKSAL